jgi:tetratricopeptide (TPR) repeat protein
MTRGRAGKRSKKRGDADARRRRWPHYVAMVGVAAIVGAAGFLGWQRLRPAPEAVPPREPEALDAQFAAYVTDFVAAVRAAPRDASRHATLGLVYEANQLYPEAQACFRTAVALDPDVPLARLHLAITTMDAGETEEAVALYRQLAADEPDLAPAQHRLGDALLEAGDIEGAAAAFERVIESAPGAPEGYIGLADAKLQAGDPRTAVGLLETALRIRPGDGMAHFLLGSAYQRLGRGEDAARELALGANAGKRPMIDEWSRLLPPHAKDLSRQMRRAITFLRAGLPDRAAEILEEMLKWHADNVDVMNNLALAYIDLKQLDQARDLLHRARRVDDARYATYVNLAFCHVLRKEPDVALEYADRAVQLNANVAQTHRMRARCLWELGRQDEAIQALEQAVGLDPQNAALRARLGHRLNAAGRYAEAKPHFELAVARTPTDVQAHLGLCEACLNLGQREDAAAALTAAQRLAPRNPAVMDMANRLTAAAAGP